MKIRLFKKKTIKDYVVEHPQAVPSFEEWITQINHADWNSPNDIRKTFVSADIPGKGSNGNNYRIICTYRFKKMKVHLYVNWIGTHAEYDRLCNDGKQYTVAGY